MQASEGMEGTAPHVLSSALNRGKCLAAHSGFFHVGGHAVLCHLDGRLGAAAEPA
jgi:hypothetical protein